MCKWNTDTLKNSKNFPTPFLPMLQMGRAEIHDPTAREVGKFNLDSYAAVIPISMERENWFWMSVEFLAHSGV